MLQQKGGDDEVIRHNSVVGANRNSRNSLSYLRRLVHRRDPRLDPRLDRLSVMRVVFKPFRGGAKFGWFLITLFFSLLGFAVFLIFTQKPSQRYTAPINRVEPGLDSRQSDFARG